LLSYNNKDGGNYSLNTDYLNVTENNRTPSRQEPLYSQKFLSKLNNKPRRLENIPINGYSKDVAKSAQKHLENVALYLLEYLHEKTNSQNLCLAGDVALNVLMNQKLMESKFVENVHLTSVPGDNGLSLGAARNCNFIYDSNIIMRYNVTSIPFN